jgi:cytochrome d ubiquinol oxidase subunit I
MDNLFAARALMGVSLGFHIIYATIGIGLPLMLMLAEGISLRTGDELYHRMARRWIRPAGLLFAIGAVSGTILSFELGFLWPRFMELSGPLIGLPFFLEGYAFFLEAIFLGLYIYGGKRLSRRTLFLCTIPLTLAAAASAVFVISANAWMNTPAGFRLEGGALADISPLQALTNPAWVHQAVHGTLAAYTATGFAMAGIYALALLRGRAPDYGSKALTLALAVGGLSLPLMLISGDLSTSFLARHEKAKFAAAEAHFETGRGAPLVIGGWPDPETKQVHFAIRIPKLLSLLAFRNPEAEVTGLDAFAADEVPDPRLVHPFFDLMVASFFLMAGTTAWFWWRRWRTGETPGSRSLLWSVVLASPFGMIALESGWLVTEFGRQPWIVHGVMRVEAGVTPNAGMGTVFLIFIIVYAVLTVGLLQMLLRQPEAGPDTETGEEGHGDA